jgi:hypothetical protein
MLCTSYHVHGHLIAIVHAGTQASNSVSAASSAKASAALLMQLGPLLDKSDPRRPMLWPTASAKSFTLVQADVTVPLQMMLLQALCNTRKVHLTSLNVSSTAAKLTAWLQVHFKLLGHDKQVNCSIACPFIAGMVIKDVVQEPAV